MSPRTSSKDSIIDAAEAVVVEVGASHLTLDAVAAKASVSKGGLMYHFPSKDALLKGMVARLVERFEQMWRQSSSALGEKPESILKAYVMTGTSRTELNRVRAALLAAAANNPKLVMPVRDYYVRRFAQFKKEGLSFEQAAIVVLATSGLWLFEQLQISPFNGKQRERIVKKIIKLAENKE